jgi:hypothetical protein
VARVLVSGQGDRLEVALAADLVAGMNSVLLVEASLLGCVVLSLQPGLRLPDALPVSDLCARQTVYKEEDIEPALERLLYDDVARADLVAHSAGTRLGPSATSRIVFLIDEMMGVGLLNCEGNP